MLTGNELKSRAHMRRLRITEQVWKDYVQDLALHLLYRKYPDLVFRGGTCIWKVMNGDRFSEDLDFCHNEKIIMLDEYLVREFGFQGFTAMVRKKKQTDNLLYLKMEISAPTHSQPIPLLIEILVNNECARMREGTVMYSPYPDIPPVSMKVPSLDEIATDKVLAILGRNKPRDVHDLYILLKQGARVDMKKAAGFNSRIFREKLLEKEKYWTGLEPLLVTALPPFRTEFRYIMSIVE